MELRRLVRGRIPWSRLEAVVAHLAERYDRERVHVRFLDADNWLSTPMVLDEELFVKVISRQNSLVHAVLTTGRNLGAFSSGTEGFFEHFGTPYQMAQHELEATRRMRDLGVDAPEPIEALEFDDLGVVVMEYLPEFESLEALDESREKELAPRLFESLRILHDNGLAHGDLRAENVLILDDDLYFIDATGVNADATEDARAYDLACALGALEPLIGARAAVESALSAYTIAELLSATEFLDFVNIRPDHDFSAASVKGEIEKRAS
jgi:tRNA A-37 threonylcarbamoyl transferase component Bud32